MTEVVKGKNVIITGANRGIGFALLEKYAMNGCNVWACIRKENQEFEQKAKEMESKFGVWIKIICFDLMNEEEIKSGMQEIVKEKEPIDILINNAGINSFSLFQMTRLCDAKDIFQVDYFAPYQIMQFVLRKMTKQKQGCIINMASIAALDSHAGDSIYGAAKAALITTSKGIAAEVGGLGDIRINSVAPGPTETDMIKINLEKIGGKIVSNSAKERLATTKEIADVVFFLTTDEARFINGEVIRVDGGKK